MYIVRFVAIFSVLISASVFQASAEPLDLELLLPKDESAPAKTPADPNAGEPAAVDNTTLAPAPAAQPTPPPPVEKSSGDVLTLPTPPTQSVNVTLPGRGMKMDQVEARFGAPLEKGQPVGKPPITRWTYPNFYVVFEHDTVLHAVLKTDQ